MEVFLGNVEFGSRKVYIAEIQWHICPCKSFVNGIEEANKWSFVRMSRLKINFKQLCTNIGACYVVEYILVKCLVLNRLWMKSDFNLLFYCFVLFCLDRKSVV